MPVDEYGIRADMWVDMNSPVGRNNPGQLYETGINRISEFVRRHVADVYANKGSEPAFEDLMDWYNDVNPNYASLIRSHDGTIQDRKKTVEDAIKHGPRIWIPPFLNTLTPNDDDFWNALTNIKKWATKWNVKSSPIKYKSLQSDGAGKEFITDEKFAIGSKYIIHLHKLPVIFAPGPAAVNHIGIPTKANYETKHFPVTVNPYRYGEDELRVMAMDTPIKEVNRFLNMLSNSPVGVNMTIQSILLSKHPTRIKRIPISNGELARTSAVLKLFHNITATLGVETKRTKIEPFNIPDELTESIWESDIIDAKNAKVGVFSDDDGVSKRDTAKRSKVQKMIESMDDTEEDVSETEEEELQE